MARTVIQINEVVNVGDLVTVVEPPGTPSVMLNLNYAHPSILNYRACTGANFVLNVGNFISTHLGTLQAIQPAIQSAVSASANNPKHREVIAFELNSRQAEDVPWETLCASGDFLALNQLSPAVARIVPMGVGTTRDRDFLPPLRILLVFAAAEVPALDEWKAFHSALQTVTCRVVVQVLAAESEVRAAVAAAAVPLNVTIQVQALADLPTLKLALQARPHLTHFFCHGQTEPMPLLRLATPADWFKGPGQESIVLRPVDLTEDRSFVDNSWLVSLSSCETAMHNSQSLSFVRELVRLGFPAVLGMRERVTPKLAQAFVGEFYQQVLAIASSLVAAPPTPVEMEWALALRRPRDTVCRIHGNGNPLASMSCKEWTLPALYIRRAPLFIRNTVPVAAVPAPAVADPTLTPEQTQLLGRIAAMRGLLDTLSQTPDTPVEILKGVETHIDELTSQLTGA